MWREKAARRATILVALVVVLACVLWALLAQSLTPSSCVQPTLPPNAGLLVCPLAPLTSEHAAP
jgi:hypothetical protein